MAEETPQRKTIYIIAGPTASGKSARALELAQEIDGEIVNCDSLQIYDGLHMLTAQPPLRDRAAVPHWLYGKLHPNETCSAGNWREMAEPIIRDILERGKTPIIVGGSGLYIKALTDGLSPMPDVPSDVRAHAVALQKKLGNPAFHDMLLKRDPEMAMRFHPFHTARLVRAWEVLEATGKSLSVWQKQSRLSPPDDWNFKTEIIIPERPVLHERCNTRFEMMMKNGVMEEVEWFAKRIQTGEVKPDAPLTKALGYKQLLAFLYGKISKEDAIELSQARTRQYAKQQVTWFRNQM